MTLTAQLGVDLPIIQAPMAGSQTSALAIAVSNAGGLGSLPCALLTHEGIRDEIAKLQAGTTRPFNVNFFCHRSPAFTTERGAAWRSALAPYYAEWGIVESPGPPGASRAPFDAGAAELLAAVRPRVVSFHFGLPPADLMARVRAVGALIFSTATTLEEARWLEAQGVDAVIAQGLEAGGHRGHFLSEDLTRQMGTFALVPQVARAVRVPVIAAGGIADAESVAAAIRLGAEAVQVGTAYLLCPEATTSAVHRAALKGEGARHTALTNLMTGRPARGVVNRLMRDIGPINPGAPEFPLAAAAIAPLRAAAERAGSGDFSPLWAGQNASGCREVPAAELTRALAADVPSR